MLGKTIYFIKKLYTGSIGDGVSYEVYKKNKQAGAELEKRIKRICETNNLKVISNAYYEVNKQGNLVEIDVLAVGREGVFIFEAKNYRNATIKASTAKNWSVEYKSGRVHSMYNPFMQNKTKVDLIKRLLSNNLKVYSVIVFPDSSITSLVNTSQGSDSVLLNIDYLNMFIATCPEIHNKKAVKFLYKSLDSLKAKGLFLSWQQEKFYNKRKKGQYGN